MLWKQDHETGRGTMGIWAGSSIIGPEMMCIRAVRKDRLSNLTSSGQGSTLNIWWRILLCTIPRCEIGVGTDILKPLTRHPYPRCSRLSALSTTVACAHNPNSGISISRVLMTDLHYLYHSLVADPTSTVTAIYSTQSHDASGGKKRPCRRAFYSAFETPGWQNNSKSDSRFSIRTVRWLGGLEQISSSESRLCALYPMDTT
jgi:hypothetical protein